MSSRTWSVKSAKLLQNRELGSVIVRLMLAMNDMGITNSSMFEWQHTKDPKKKARWKGAVLYFGRVQSAHLFEALSIIREIENSPALKAAVDRSDSTTRASFAAAVAFLRSDDFKLMAKMRNVIAFHYDPKLSLRRLERLAEEFPDHSMMYSLGSDTLDWYFELGDLIADGIVIRDVFEIDEKTDVQTGVIEVLDRLHIMGTAFTDFAGYFIRACCAK